MSSLGTYQGGLTAEQFLFSEIRIVSQMYLDGVSTEEIVQRAKEENLFQYPTEREIGRMARACCKRIEALNNPELVSALACAPVRVAKQINLYAIMRYNRIAWDFMVCVIGEKFLRQDMSFGRRDINLFFTELQAKNDVVAQWSDGTVNKIKSVLTKILVETEYLDTVRSAELNPVFLCEELEQGIRANHDFDALPAFYCFP